MKYKSEAFRHGNTKNEEYMLESFRLMHIPAIANYVFCFECGDGFQITNGQYPNHCYRCQLVYYEKGQYAMPDLMIPDPTIDFPKAVIYINSEKYHRSNKKQRNKDRDQIEKYCQYKIPVFIIDNEEIDSLRTANRCLLALGIKAAIEQPQYRLLAYEGEKELI